MPIEGTIGFIGAGNMAEAILRGILKSSLVSPDNVIASDIRSERLKELKKSIYIQTSHSNREVISNADTIVLSVKPQNMNVVFSEISMHVKSGQCFISIAAGWRTEKIEERLGGEPRVVRVMPNTPALLGCGASALCKGKYTQNADLSTALEIFRSIGIAITVTEDMMDAVTGLSGSGPAYFFYLIECLVKAGGEVGLSEEDASKLVIQTAFGTARMIVETGHPPAHLREAVTSPGGTTFAGLEVMRNADFEKIILDTVKAATNRSKELGK